MGLSKLTLSLLALSSGVIGADLPAITIKGQKFFYENGTQFFMKGVAYQQESSAGGATSSKTKFVDPLADTVSCKRDIPLLKELGTNTIRTYAIDPEADHSECMKLLNDAGIYVVSDLSEPSLSINRDDPQWNVALYERYTAVVDELAKYPNVIGFFAGNEVSNNKTNTPASAFVKAAVRDTKKHIKDKKYRPMGVGYAANDDADIRADIADYFNCGKPEESIDFWGYNIYSWCGESTMAKSGYDKQVDFFKDYSVPIFFAEYGCNLPDGAAARIFQETGALYSDAMTEVFSGGIVYMYHQEANDYGLVKITGGKAVKQKDFNALKTQVLKADPKGVDMDDYKVTLKAASCPKISDSWAAASVLPPLPDSSLCKCMTNSRSCIRAKDLDEEDYGEMFGYICGKAPEICTGIVGNTTTGVYGAYSMCADGDKLDYVLDAFYSKSNKAASSCDFKGKAQVVSAKSESKCSAALASASSINKQAATATAPPNAGSTGGSGDDEGNFAVAGTPLARLFSVGDYAVGLYMVVAMCVGAGMVAL